MHVPRILLGLGFLFALALPPAHALDGDDPPARVARLNHYDGSVAFSEADSDDWSRVQVNRPLVSGDRIWVEQGARSELHIGSTAIRLGGQTSLGFLHVDDDVAQLKLTQGSLSLHVRRLSGDDAYDIATPNLSFSIREPGLYRIDVAPDGGMTTVTVRDGSGVAYGVASSTVITERQQVSFIGTDLDVAGAAADPPYDSFDQWAASRARAEEASTTARYVSREVIGYEQLDAYGSWRHVPQYGMVWTPRHVAAGWAPYRSGHWSWIAPWGWTWIDDAPWGFAPFHYGRWAYVGRTWCWVPGPTVVRPVYAPALVAFVGGSGFRFSLSVGNAAPGVGWIPLAPGEHYRPAYRSSPDHVRNLNRMAGSHGGEQRTVYRNRHAPHAITAVPVSAFSRGAPVLPVARSVQPAQLDHGATIGQLPDIRPNRAAMAGNRRLAAPPAPHRIIERQVVTVGRHGADREYGRRDIVVRTPPSHAPQQQRHRDDDDDGRNRAFRADQRHDVREAQAAREAREASAQREAARRDRQHDERESGRRAERDDDGGRWRREQSRQAHDGERPPRFGGRPETVTTRNERREPAVVQPATPAQASRPPHQFRQPHADERRASAPAPSGQARQEQAEARHGRGQGQDGKQDDRKEARQEARRNDEPQWRNRQAREREGGGPGQAPR